MTPIEHIIAEYAELKGYTYGHAERLFEDGFKEYARMSGQTLGQFKARLNSINEDQLSMALNALVERLGN